jgi:hypothetical protein
VIKPKPLTRFFPRYSGHDSIVLLVKSSIKERITVYPTKGKKMAIIMRKKKILFMIVTSLFAIVL